MSVELSHWVAVSEHPSWGLMGLPSRLKVIDLVNRADYVIEGELRTLKTNQQLDNGSKSTALHVRLLLSLLPM